jgi:hypothetical protein
VLPLRDEGAISLGLSKLPALFIGSLFLTLIAAPLSTLLFSFPNFSKSKVGYHFPFFFHYYCDCNNKITEMGFDFQSLILEISCPPPPPGFAFDTQVF